MNGPLPLLRFSGHFIRQIPFQYAEVLKEGGRSSKSQTTFHKKILTLFLQHKYSFLTTVYNAVKIIWRSTFLAYNFFVKLPINNTFESGLKLKNRTENLRLQQTEKVVIAIGKMHCIVEVLYIIIR